MKFKKTKLIIALVLATIMFVVACNPTTPDDPDPVYATLTFASTGGTPSTIEPITQLVGSTLNLPEVTRPHHAFGGWFLDAGFSQPLGNTMPAGGGTVHARWVHSGTRDISFVTNGGNDLNDMVGLAGQPFVAPTPVRAGRRFGGWFLDAGFNARFSGTLSPDITPMTLYARWLVPPIGENAVIDILDVAPIENNAYFTITWPEGPGGVMRIQNNQPLRNNWPGIQGLLIPINESMFFSEFVMTYRGTADVGSFLRVGPAPATASAFYGNLYNGATDETVRTLRVPINASFSGTNFPIHFAPLAGTAGAEAANNVLYVYSMELITWEFEDLADPADIPTLLTVDFVTNGGNEMSSIIAEAGEDISGLLTRIEPTRPARRFAGWFLDENFETPFSGTLPALEEPAFVTLYARWQVELSSQCGLDNIRLGTVGNFNITRENGGPVRIEATAPNTGFANIHFYALEEGEREFSISLRGTPGRATTLAGIAGGDIHIYHGALNEVLTRGRSFANPITSINIMPLRANGAIGDVVYIEDLTFSTWEYDDLLDLSPATIVFNTRGGNEVASVEVAPGSGLVGVTNPTRGENFRFGGWYLDDNFETPFTLVPTAAAGQTLTLYARWSQRQTFDIIELQPNPRQQTTPPPRFDVTFEDEYMLITAVSSENSFPALYFDIPAVANTVFTEVVFVFSGSTVPEGGTGIRSTAIRVPNSGRGDIHTAHSGAEQTVNFIFNNEMSSAFRVDILPLSGNVPSGQNEYRRHVGDTVQVYDFLLVGWVLEAPASNG